jgi:hypothetical protein
MFLDRLEDAGMPVYGDRSRVDPRIQGIADAVLPLLPNKMGASMHVSVSEGGLSLAWHAPRASFTVHISRKRAVKISVFNQYAQDLWCRDGESSDLAKWIDKGISHYAS